MAIAPVHHPVEAGLHVAGEPAGLPVGLKPLWAQGAIARQKVTDKVGVGPVARQLQGALLAQRDYVEGVHPL